LGLKNGSSETLGLLDVTAGWEAFEHINQVSVEITLSNRSRGSTWKLLAEARAYDAKPGATEVLPLAYESATCLASEWRSLDVVVFRLLYALDSALASAEFQEGKKAVKPLPPQ